MTKQKREKLESSITYFKNHYLKMNIATILKRNTRLALE